MIPVIKGRARILDWDIEQRPLSYWYDDKPTAQITAIASCWLDDPESMEVYLLGEDSPRRMLEWFVRRYDEAGMVVGHYIRKFDLPNVNGALQELGMPILGPKMTHDTKLDLVVRGDIPATQEHMADMLGVEAGKYHMRQSMWREANKLTEAGIALTKERVVDDVIQNMALYRAELKAGILKPPKVWRP